MEVRADSPRFAAVFGDRYFYTGWEGNRGENRRGRISHAEVGNDEVAHIDDSSSRYGRPPVPGDSSVSRRALFSQEIDSSNIVKSSERRGRSAAFGL